MKKFFAEHSYDMVKMLLNQIAIAIFGITLVFAAGQAENPTLRNITSVCAILFYLFLLYTMTWEIGYRDKISVEQGRKAKNHCRGALICLCANLPNFIFAILITLAALLPNETIDAIGDVARFISLIFEGMYTGILANHVGGVPLNAHCWIYFLLPLPAILTTGIAYYLGIKDIKFTSLFDPITPESDRDPSERKGRKKHD